MSDYVVYTIFSDFVRANFQGLPALWQTGEAWTGRVILETCQIGMVLSVSYIIVGAGILGQGEGFNDFSGFSKN